MANFDSSWISLGADENNLMCVDPIAAAQALKRAINRLTGGEVGAAAMRFRLNIRWDAMILRNRLERYEMRRHFGADVVPWNPARDEPTEESPSVHSPSSSSRHSAANFLPNRVSEQAAVAGLNPIHEPPSTGQSMGRFRDPISMEMPLQTFRSQVQIELGDSRMAVVTAGADSHVAPAAQNTEAPRQVSISSLSAFPGFRESSHNPRAQSTRYPLSPSRPYENSTFVENSMNLTCTASTTGGVPPTTTGEITTRASAIFDRDSYLPLPNLLLQQRRPEVASSTRYPRSDFGVVVSSTGSLFPSLVPQSSASAGNFEHINCSTGSMSLFSEHAARGTGAAVYSQCSMPRGVPCYQEPPFMPSGSVAPNSFTAAVSQASGYGARLETVRAYYNRNCRRSFIIRLVLFRNR